MRKLTHDDASAGPWRAILIAAGAALGTVGFCQPSLAADSNAAAGLQRTTPNAAPPQPDAFRHDLKASDVMSSDVHDASGDYIGKAEDLLLDPQTGRITAAIVDVKDFFGVSTKKVVIPVQDLKISGDRQLTTTLDRRKLLAEKKPAGE